MKLQNRKILLWMLWFIQGVVVGFGAIMPGISGGTLCVAFGMYLPIMRTISHPLQNIKKYALMLGVFICGAAFGFVGLSGFAGWLMKMNSTLVTCAFIGFILGTVPELWRDAGIEGRTKKSYAALAVGFAVMLAILILLQKTDISSMKADFIGYIFCGILWGISFIVPGLSSSTLLLFFGLYEPMLDGIAAIDFSVILPIIIGIAACVAILSKAVNSLYKNHYNSIYHLVIGVVIATVIMIIPDWSVDARALLYRAVCILCGAVVSYGFTKLCDKIKKEG